MPASALTRSPVIRVNASRSGYRHPRERLNDLEHISTRTEVAVRHLLETIARMSGRRIAGRGKRSRISAYDSNVSGFLRSGRFSVNIAYPSVVRGGPTQNDVGVRLDNAHGASVTWHLTRSFGLSSTCDELDLSGDQMRVHRRRRSAGESTEKMLVNPCFMGARHRGEVALAGRRHAHHGCPLVFPCDATDNNSLRLSTPAPATSHYRLWSVCVLTIRPCAAHRVRGQAAPADQIAAATIRTRA